MHFFNSSQNGRIRRETAGNGRINEDVLTGRIEDGRIAEVMRDTS